MKGILNREQDGLLSHRGTRQYYLRFPAIFFSPFSFLIDMIDSLFGSKSQPEAELD